MPRRTLGDGRTALEERRSLGLPDAAYRKATEQLDAAEADARRAAEEHVARAVEELNVTYDTAARELTEARDAYDDLTARGATGRLTARAYADELHAARIRQERAEAALDRME